jgi:hypothetical protein
MPKIRLDERPRPDARGERVYRHAVAQEMLSARESARNRSLDPADPRWKFALETQQALQGAVLSFEDRRRLLSLAQRTGIRAFDANLIIALVQDRARRGEPVEHAAATIAIVPRPETRDARGGTPRDAIAQTNREGRTTASGCDEHVDAEPGGRFVHLLIPAVILAMAADAMLIAWLAFG